DHIVKQLLHGSLVGDVGVIGANLPTATAAHSSGFGEPLLIDVDQCQVRALGSQRLRNGTTQTTARSGGHDDLVFDFHASHPCMNGAAPRAQATPKAPIVR